MALYNETEMDPTPRSAKRRRSSRCTWAGQGYGHVELKRQGGHTGRVGVGGNSTTSINELVAIDMAFFSLQCVGNVQGAEGILAFQQSLAPKEKREIGHISMGIWECTADVCGITRICAGGHA